MWVYNIKECDEEPDGWMDGWTNGWIKRNRTVCDLVVYFCTCTQTLHFVPVTLALRQNWESEGKSLCEC